MIVKASVDNTRSSAKCPNIIIRLIRTIKAHGFAIDANGRYLQQNQRILYPFEENVVIASRFFDGVAAGAKQADYSQEIKIFLDDIAQQYRSSKRKKKEDFAADREGKLFYKEDLCFATKGVQPSTVGSVFNCLYTIIVNRDVRGMLNYPTGIGVLMTINPSEEQVNGGF